MKIQYAMAFKRTTNNYGWLSPIPRIVLANELRSQRKIGKKMIRTNNGYVTVDNEVLFVATCRA